MVDAFLRSWPLRPWLLVTLLVTAAIYLRGWIVLHRRDGRNWHFGAATLLPGDNGLARRRQLDHANKWIGRADGLIFRAEASRPTTIRIDRESRALNPRVVGEN